MKTYGLLYKLSQSPNGVFHDAFSDLRNSVYSDLGLSQSTLDSANNVINDPSFQQAVAGVIAPSTQGVPASASIQNLVSQIKAKPLPYIIIGAVLAFAALMLFKRR